MKISLTIILLSICCVCLSQSPYNNDTAVDAVMVKVNWCYVYPTPQTVFNLEADTTLICLPRGMIISTLGYCDNYFKVSIDGKIGYIHSYCVTTPKRIRELQFKIQKPYILKSMSNKVSNENKITEYIDNENESQYLDWLIWSLINE